MSDLGNNKIFAQNLQKFMDSKNIDRSTLCKDLDLKYSTVSEWLSAKKYPRIDKIELIANYFGIKKSDLIEHELRNSYSDYGIFPLPKTKKLPLLGTIACGEPILADENIEEYIETPVDISATFCLRCQGDSMINARIFDGDIVYIREQPDVENGEIAAVLIDDSATLKRVYKFPDKVVLQPENPAYEPLVFIKEEINNIKILGKAVAFTSTVK